MGNLDQDMNSPYNTKQRLKVALLKRLGELEVELHQLSTESADSSKKSIYSGACRNALDKFNRGFTYHDYLQYEARQAEVLARFDSHSKARQTLMSQLSRHPPAQDATPNVPQASQDQGGTQSGQIPPPETLDDSLPGHCGNAFLQPPIDSPLQAQLEAVRGLVQALQFVLRT